MIGIPLETFGFQELAASYGVLVVKWGRYLVITVIG
jgi:hypothetical protein